jgi:hypothetical protein
MQTFEVNVISSCSQSVVASKASGSFIGSIFHSSDKHSGGCSLHGGWRVLPRWGLAIIHAKCHLLSSKLSRSSLFLAFRFLPHYNSTFSILSPSPQFSLIYYSLKSLCYSFEITILENFPSLSTLQIDNSSITRCVSQTFFLQPFWLLRWQSLLLAHWVSLLAIPILTAAASPSRIMSETLTPCRALLNSFELTPPMDATLRKTSFLPRKQRASRSC